MNKRNLNKPICLFCIFAIVFYKGGAWEKATFFLPTERHGTPNVSDNFLLWIKTGLLREKGHTSHKVYLSTVNK